MIYTAVNINDCMNDGLIAESKGHRLCYIGGNDSPKSKVQRIKHKEK